MSNDKVLQGNTLMKEALRTTYIKDFATRCLRSHFLKL